VRRFTPSSIILLHRYVQRRSRDHERRHLAFLFVAVAGSVAGKIDPGKGGRIGAGVIGAVLLVLGIVLKVAAPGSESAAAKEGEHAEVASEATAAPGDDVRRAEEQRLEEQRRADAQRALAGQQLEQERAATQAAQLQPAGGVRFFGDLLYLNGTARLPLAGAHVERGRPVFLSEGPAGQLSGERAARGRTPHRAPASEADPGARGQGRPAAQHHSGALTDRGGPPAVDLGR
jgi:hypothetical protein